MSLHLTLPRHSKRGNTGTDPLQLLSSHHMHILEAYVHHRHHRHHHHHHHHHRPTSQRREAAAPWLVTTVTMLQPRLLHNNPSRWPSSPSPSSSWADGKLTSRIWICYDRYKALNERGPAGGVRVSCVCVCACVRTCQQQVSRTSRPPAHI